MRLSVRLENQLSLYVNNKCKYFSKISTLYYFKDSTMIVLYFCAINQSQKIKGNTDKI